MSETRSACHSKNLTDVLCINVRRMRRLTCVASAIDENFGQHMLLLFQYCSVAISPFHITTMRRHNPLILEGAGMRYVLADHHLNRVTPVTFDAI